MFNENLYMQNDKEKAQYYKNGNIQDAIIYSLNEINRFLDIELNIRRNEYKII